MVRLWLQRNTSLQTRMSFWQPLHHSSPCQQKGLSCCACCSSSPSVWEQLPVQVSTFIYRSPTEMEVLRSLNSPENSAHPSRPQVLRSQRKITQRPSTSWRTSVLFNRGVDLSLVSGSYPSQHNPDPAVSDGSLTSCSWASQGARSKFEVSMKVRVAC